MLSEAFTSIEGNPFFYFFTKGTYDFFSIGIRNTMYEGMFTGIFEENCYGYSEEIHGGMFDAIH